MLSRSGRVAGLTVKCVKTWNTPCQPLRLSRYHCDTKEISSKCTCQQAPSTVRKSLLLYGNGTGYSPSSYSDRLFISPRSTLCQTVRTYRTGSRHRTHRTSVSDTNEKSKDPNLGRDNLVKQHDEKSEVDAPQDPPQTGGIFQRFKQAYKEHGKVLIGVHVITSTVWFGSFYYAASTGIDVVPWLESMGLSETIIKPFKSSNVGNIALAYLMYKLATPARYTVTLGGTNLMIKYLRKTGRMEPVAEGQSLRELYKEGKVQMKEQRHKIPKFKAKK